MKVSNTFDRLTVNSTPEEIARALSPEERKVVLQLASTADVGPTATLPVLRLCGLIDVVTVLDGGRRGAELTPRGKLVAAALRSTAAPHSKSGTPKVGVARVDAFHGSMLDDISIARLSNGASIRVRRDAACTIKIGSTIAYDLDEAGNRHSPRIATGDDRRAAGVR